VGIKEYVSDGHPFSGILKHRFSDFIVNEIGLDGNEVRLTSLGLDVV
jgi:tRNA pseudouridine13 synthase